MFSPEYGAAVRRKLIWLVGVSYGLGLLYSLASPLAALYNYNIRRLMRWLAAGGACLGLATI